MRKKILFMIINMNVGGTEKALLNMITLIPPEKYELTVLMLEEYGGFLPYIPKEVKIECLSKFKNIKHLLDKPPQVTAVELLFRGKILKALNIVFLHTISKLTNNRSTFFKYVLKDCPRVEKTYDIAVAYAGPMDFITYYVLKRIKSKKKVQWIHFDVTKVGFNINFARKTYKEYDKIFVASKEGKDKLISMIPNLADKTDSFTNIISPETIVKMADEGSGFEDSFNGVRILTVGRLCKEKGQDLTISVLTRLKKAGCNVRWYCIGEGSSRKEYEQLIKDHGVENDYILLGSCSNPYPFMKQCDIYVQSSRHEGYCITLAEAKCFANPIITTNFVGASEQIIHNKTGLIVSFDKQQLYDAIKKLIDDKELRNKIKPDLENRTVDTTRELEKLYLLLDTGR